MDSGGVQSNYGRIGGTTLEPTLAEICADEANSNLLSCHVLSQYNGTQGNNGIYYHTSSLPNGAGDNSYRYSGANPNNYVCFGSNSSTCSSDNLYRIIGVFDDEVKLIKSTSYGSYVWDSGYDNTWDATTKPDIYTTLNSTYLNSLGNTWSSRISTHNYEVGGGSFPNLTYGPNGVPQNAYRYEVGENQTGYEESMKIGLIYVSDYYYGASPTYWTYPGFTNNSFPDTNGNYGNSYDYRATTGSNWMHLGSEEWTVSHDSEFTVHVFNVNSSGSVDGYSVDYSFAVRPVFYLNSTVQYVSGTGTSNNPIRIN